MAWATGTITSATPHTALSTAIKALFGGSGVANWSFVENVPAGTGTGQSGSASYSVDVYKCMGSGTDANDAANDFYVALRIPIPDGVVGSSFHCFEVYSPIADATNKGKGKRFCTNSPAVPTGVSYWFGDTYRTFAAADGTFTTQPVNTSGFTYYIKLTKNMLFVSYQVGAAASMWFASLIDSFVVNVTDDLPLVAGAATIMGFSRVPGSVNNISLQFAPKVAAWTRGVMLATSNAANDNDLWQGNKIFTSRVLVVSQASVTSWYQSGGLRGLLKQDILCFKSGGTINLGDTFVLGGNTWTVIAHTTSNLPWTNTDPVCYAVRPI